MTDTFHPGPGPAAPLTDTAFRRLFDVVLGATATITEGPRRVEHPTTAAEAYRNLLDVLSVGVDCFVKADPLRPTFTEIVSPTRKFGGDNRDARYHHARIDPTCTYRVFGHRGDAVYLSLTVYGGPPDGRWTDRIVGTRNDRTLPIADDGTFELFVGPDVDPTDPKALVVDGNACDLVTRDYVDDRDRDEPSHFEIERIDGDPGPPRNSDEDLAARIDRAANFVADLLNVVPLAFDPAKANQLDEPYAQPPITYGWAAGDAAYCMGWYDLADDEALLIRGRSPECAFWNICLWDPMLVTYDYRYEHVTLNGAEAEVAADGSWEVVVAKEDPGRANWLSTADHPRGLIWFRWFLAEHVPTRPDTEVVPVASLRT